MSLERVAVGLVCAIVLAACGGSGSSRDTIPSGTLTVGLTDAAVDMVEQVRLYVTGITIKPQGGPAESYSLSLVDCGGMPGETDTCNPVDLLSLQDGNTLTLISGLALEAGRYQWLRLDVDETRSYIVEGTGGVDGLEVRIPSERGLQLSGGFVILADESTQVVMDWDARQGLTNPVGLSGYTLKPSVRITDTSEHGSISGSVLDRCGVEGVVYVFEDDLLPPAPEIEPSINLDDIDNNDPNPLVTASVSQRGDGTFGYAVHFLPVGTYTAAFTCDDDPVPTSDTDPGEANDDVEFVGPQVAVVENGTTTSVNFL